MSGRLHEGERRMRWGGKLAVALCGLALAGAAGAEESTNGDAVSIEVTILEVSDQPGEADPRCERFDKILRGQIPYESLAVLDSHRREVSLNEVWSLQLPTARTLQLRPLEVSSQGTLLSLDVEESVQGDFRVHRGQPLVVGGPRYGEGRLVVVVDTE
jgi:hypothetical protein